ncbi:MAG TPA: antibiotic biosynthesis monooxygenase [Planctomycetota bacterium]|nr:antibiotic biosynthesis monooxygenase [Planctomycetota bacterium]
MYHVIVRMEAKPEKAAQLLELATYNSGCSRQEPGNVRFDVLRQNDQPLRFALYEVYRDEAAFKAHQQTEHYARWRREIDALLAAPRTSDKFSSVAPEPYA